MFLSFRLSVGLGWARFLSFLVSRLFSQPVQRDAKGWGLFRCFPCQGARDRKEETRMQEEARGSGKRSYSNVDEIDQTSFDLASSNIRRKIEVNIWGERKLSWTVCPEKYGYLHLQSDGTCVCWLCFLRICYSYGCDYSHGIVVLSYEKFRNLFDIKWNRARYFSQVYLKYAVKIKQYFINLSI